MGLPLIEACRLAQMSFAGYDSEKQRKRFATPTPDAQPEKVLAISGLFSNERHLARVKAVAEERLPAGSEVALHNFASGVNLSLFDTNRWGDGSGPVKLLDRKKERIRIDDRIKKLADEQGGPITIFGHSLGGVLGYEASLRNPAEVKSVITAGSPLGMPEIGVAEKSETSTLHVVYANKDRVVFPIFVTNGHHDTITQTFGGHMSLITRSAGINAIVDKMPGVLRTMTNAA